MFKTRFSLFLLFLSLLSFTRTEEIRAQEYSVEKKDGPPVADELSADFQKVFAENGIRVKRGSRTALELWLCKELTVSEDFTATTEMLYPFEPGQLIGLLHLPRRGSDFRDQTISSGWYTLRFGLQPVDGNHEGTSLTRDFLVLVNLEKDQVGKEWDAKTLATVSAEAAGSTHPAMMCLQKPTEGDDTAIRHNESRDWWILHTIGKKAGKGEPLAIDLIAVGHADE
ncbi:MAG: hypothetical protein KDB22_06385 [Planctomycetales bacterium]|nr:hypothetical protein [Planctomycetales bacterium]